MSAQTQEGIFSLIVILHIKFRVKFDKIETFDVDLTLTNQAFLLVSHIPSFIRKYKSFYKGTFYVNFQFAYILYIGGY